MKSQLKLDDVALFLAVADAGGLSAAARRAGASVPTLSRRMAELEYAVGQKLFQRGNRGYSLTAEGRAFLQEAEPLRELASRLSGFAKTDTQTRVRVTTGHWTSRFLASNILGYWSPDAIWVPEFVETVNSVDIARREADIGVRSRRPDQPWLAGRQTHVIEFAAFAVSPAVPGYVVRSDLQSEGQTQTESWLQANYADEIVTTANNAELAADLALAGVGRIILPVFAAPLVPGLQRVGPVIDELTRGEWLVCHHEGRHDPPVRAALDAISRCLCDRTLRPSPAVPRC